ncbi:MAG: adenine phosphoribosyltransferase [Defluviitaleaceae bacterium]|nr:adenine phosphoribosyltransferase [Defluviitaleaceae bacterium]
MSLQKQKMSSSELKNYVRDIPDFPIPGILFRDITTVLKNPAALRGSIDAMVELLGDLEYDTILGPESRGFIFGMPMAYNQSKGFVPVRKAGKLPADVVKREYALEYGTATIEIHRDAIVPGHRYIIADDLLATGGTAKAIADLVMELGGVIVSALFFIELAGLSGRDVLAGYDVRSVLSYE